MCQAEGLLAGKVVKATACGAAHLLALTADGGVFASRPHARRPIVYTHTHV